MEPLAGKVAARHAAGPWQVPAFYPKLAVKVRRAFTIGQSQGRIR